MDNYCRRIISELDKERHYVLQDGLVKLSDKDNQNEIRMTSFEASEMMLRQIGAVCSPDLPPISIYEQNNRDRIIKKMKEDYSMTFVGIMKNKNGMVAFGDSKVTKLNTEDFKLYEYGNTQKVFKSDNILVVTYDNANDSLILGERPIAEIINKILKHNPDITSQKFKTKLQKRLKSDKTFQFIVSCKDEQTGEYQIMKLTLSSESGNYVKLNLPIDTNYCPDELYKKYKKALEPDLSLVELCHLARQFVQDVYGYYENNNDIDYNPIGGSIYIKSLPDIGEDGIFSFKS